jgi:hypothetical protein
MSFRLQPINQAKLDRLKQIGFGNCLFAELVAIQWPAPTGTICYAMNDYDRLDEYKGIKDNADFQALTQNPIEARFAEKVFQKVNHGSTIDDSTTTFELIDDDGEIARLCELHGEGVRCSILFYFPEVDWLRERWWGHIETPAEVGGIMTPVPASFGFRSSQSSLPCRTRGGGCSFRFGGGIDDLAEIAANPCRYDRHKGGVHGLLDGDGKPFTTCDHTQPACLARLGDLMEYGGGDTAADTLVVSETKGPNVNATAQGNETTLKNARRVVFGQVKMNEMECLASIVEPDTNHPDKGSARVVSDGCEGPIAYMVQCYIYNQFVGAQHLNVRLGTYRQPRTAFSPNVNNYNMTALFEGVIQGDFRGFAPGQFKGSARVGGLNNIRVYSDAETFVEQFSDRPGWCILRMLTDKVWGDGQDYIYFVIQDWIDVEAYLSLMAGFLDAQGNFYTSIRASFNAILEERTTQQQISDACLFAGLSLPFPLEGKTRIMPLKEEDLSDVPVFSDDLDVLASDPTIRPILLKDNVTTLRTKQVFSQAKGELIDYLVATFLDAAHDNVERPLTFQDDELQRAEGKAAGNQSRRIAKAEYSLLGVTDFGQAVRVGNRLLDLGEFDRGGKMNNREVSFDADFLDTLDLHKYKVIKVISKPLELYKLPNNPDKHFQYFRVQDQNDEDDLIVHLRCVAYNEDYYAKLDDATQPPARMGNDLLPNPAGTLQDRPNLVVIDTLTHTNDRIHLRLALPT